ncbi:hypothetical protein SteCoe_15596 [Stentor coeruleus]|uniref:Uncharacterized protein n=1 Tax=Stentor coeruleus TaxID=5963 RepID=A0A1R2C396_9CILI|nr:hypothetical protein SteCoe_15596 [Stentor coeruleus]
MHRPKNRFSSQLYHTPKSIRPYAIDKVHFPKVLSDLDNLQTLLKPIHIYQSKSLPKLPSSTRNTSINDFFKQKPSLEELLKLVPKPKTRIKKSSLEPVNIHMNMIRLNEKTNETLVRKIVEFSNSNRKDSEPHKFKNLSKKKVSFITMDFQSSTEKHRIV